MYNGNNLSIIFSSNNRIIINSTKKLDNWPFTDVSCTTRTMQIDPLVYSINGGVENSLVSRRASASLFTRAGERNNNAAALSGGLTLSLNRWRNFVSGA